MSSKKRNEIRPEYPEELIRSGVRGKYAARIGRERTSSFPSTLSY